MHRNWIGALLVAGGLVLASLTGAWAVENLSAATKRLFDAVWTDNMAQVRASIVDGADLTAINEFGVRAVDMAVDKGHYGIAHYLLSVEKQRDDQSTTAQPIPVPTPFPSGVLAPQPVPAPQPIATATPAPISGGIPTPVSTINPVSNPEVAANEPPPQPEAMWKPTVEGGDASAPKIKVLGMASPQPLLPVPSSPSQKVVAQATPKEPGVLKQSLQREEDKGMLGKVKDFFSFSSKPEAEPESQSETASIAETETNDGPSLFDRVLEIFTVDETPVEDVSAAASAEQVTPPSPSPEQTSLDTAPSPEPIEAPTVETPQVAEPAEVESTSIVSTEPEVAELPNSIIDSLSEWLKRDAPEEEPEPAMEQPELMVREAEPPAAVAPITALTPEPTPAPLPQSLKISEPAPDVVQKPKPGDVRVVRAPKPEMTASTPGAEPAPVAEPTPTSAPTPTSVQAPVKPASEMGVVTPQSELPAKSRRVKAPALGPAMSSPARIIEPMIASASLKDVAFKLGDAASLGMKLVTGKEHPKTCVDKSRWQTEFCIEKIAWPKAVAPSFHAESSVYRGEKAIVQYVNGQSVQLHALFPVKALMTVTEHFKKLYGPPTETFEVWTALVGEPKRPNRVLRWHSRNTKTGAETLLEIREIDDLRWSSPPDIKHGVVRIFDKDRGSVFRLLSSTDLLLARLRNSRR